MQVWNVIYDPLDFPDSLYRSALPLVDQTAQSKISKFYRREDACRSLIGNLLPRVLLKKRGVAKDAMTFAATETGKPYCTTPLDPPLAFNVTHDEGAIAMAFGTGVDVMKLKIPPRTTFTQFVDIVDSQLTVREKNIVLADVPEEEAIRRFYWIWTLKEAYTKALGIGLGFDFRRIEYDVLEEKVTIDGELARGWQFLKFEVPQSGHKYVGVAAKFIGGRGTSISDLSEGCLVCYDAVSFVNRAIEEMS
ncbi:uncharacterized protein EDB91DRAFT_1234202 [Suillus paluster]|uniref:uncharacterized protein n=1 Tax=Suillus paluster TaxID=48578 RepID=UPI001B87B191|nr:uncharacterized protein EDB91DRAFT_1234202 [Suillus paluster]KAG1753820.1 hypothetical protein EDB91DRAFT_1234202 [Suillus paluster]